MNTISLNSKLKIFRPTDAFQYISEITAEKVSAVTGEDVSDPAILLATTAALACRYTGCGKITLEVKTADSSAPIEMDADYAASTANDLFVQSHLKLEGFFGLSADISDMTVELPGDMMRPVMRSINESADSGAAIQIQFEKARDKRVCRFIYSEKHYADELIQQMARHFSNILSDITERPDILIKDIRMLDREEETRIIERGAGQVVETGNKCAHHLFEERAAKNPDATALICGKQRMSCGELNARANVIGHYLQYRLGSYPWKSVNASTWKYL